MTLRNLARIASAGMLVLSLHHSAWAEAGKEDSGTPAGHAAGQQLEPVFAVVGNQVITQQQFEQAFAMAARQKFYHGNPPQDQVAMLQREVGNNLVNNILLIEEAKRRGIGPNAESVQKQIEQYEKRYEKNERWQVDRERVLPDLTKYLEHISILKEFERQVRDIPSPPEEQVRAYYDANPDKFTQPEQVHIRVILLRVDPSSPSETWKKTEEEAKGLVAEIRGGESFAEMAKEHSDDISSKDGGDMGMLHRGTLPAAAQVVLDKMQPGDVSDPTILLEGVAIFRLEARKPAQKRDFADVQERAAGLLMRELSEKAWVDLIAQLRSQTTVMMDDSRFLPLDTANEKK